MYSMYYYVLYTLLYILFKSITDYIDLFSKCPILSGTLPSCNHGGISHPRRGIAIILQILNDLLRAACHHQEALLPPLCDDCTASKPSGNHLTAVEPCRGRNRHPPTQSTEGSGKYYIVTTKNMQLIRISIFGYTFLYTLFV